MSGLQEEIEATLGWAAEQLRLAALPSELALQFEQLAAQAHQPCVVAVVGRVKAGKSSFINALLGQDLAVVGTTETTATINYFRSGRPEPARPVLCHWRNGDVTHESVAFLERLQGHDLESLRLAEGIDHLEYLVPASYLERVTLVDTPGTTAAVSEHEQRTAEFLHLAHRLRERHHQQTERLASQADAIIYLVGPAVGDADRVLLEAFQQVTQGHTQALNALGVLAKIDLDPALLQQRAEVADRIMANMRQNVTAVVPVSAALYRAMDRLLADQGSALQALIDRLRCIPAARLTQLLRMYDLFVDLEAPDCPVTPEQRRQLCEGIPWRAFVRIAEVAADSTLTTESVARQLIEESGFEQLKQTLERLFLARGEFLRSYRIVHDASRLIKAIRFTHLPAAERRIGEARAQQQRFLTFIARAQGDPQVAAELRAFLEAQFTDTATVQRISQAVERAVAGLLHRLEQHQADFVALEQLEEPGPFTQAERDELRPLFGRYGLEIADRLGGAMPPVQRIETRQRFWQTVGTWDQQPVRRAVGEHAVVRYGLILDELPKQGS